MIYLRCSSSKGVLFSLLVFLALPELAFSQSPKYKKIMDVPQILNTEISHKEGDIFVLESQDRRADPVLLQYSHRSEDKSLCSHYHRLLPNGDFSPEAYPYKYESQVSLGRRKKVTQNGIEDRSKVVVDSIDSVGSKESSLEGTVFAIAPSDRLLIRVDRVIMPNSGRRISAINTFIWTKFEETVRSQNELVPVSQTPPLPAPPSTEELPPPDFNKPHVFLGYEEAMPGGGGQPSIPRLIPIGSQATRPKRSASDGELEDLLGRQSAGFDEVNLTNSGASDPNPPLSSSVP